MSGIEEHIGFLEVSTCSTSSSSPRPVAFDSCRRASAVSAVWSSTDRPRADRSTTCQLHMRHLAGGSLLQGRFHHHDRARGAPPVSRCCVSLIVDRSALDRIVQAGGYISSTPVEPEASVPVQKEKADAARRPPASAAVLVWPPAPMPLPCCSRVQKIAPGSAAAGSSERRPRGEHAQPA